MGKILFSLVCFDTKGESEPPVELGPTRGTYYEVPDAPGGQSWTQECPVMSFFLQRADSSRYQAVGKHFGDKNRIMLINWEDEKEEQSEGGKI